MKNQGITLVALIITIIVMLVLAGTTVGFVLNQDGIVARAIEAQKAQKETEQKEKNELEQLYSSMIIATNDSSQITINLEDLNKIIDERIKKANVTSVPAGTVISYIVGAKAPAGYLKCDGTEYNIREYQTLAEAIKTGFGSYNYYGGDGITTFAVPDLRGEFLRGTGTATRNTGTGEDVGKHQDGTILPTFGNYNNVTLFIDMPGSGYYSENTADKCFGTGIRYYRDIGISSGPSSVNSMTSRPTNTSVLYCIKY